MFAGCSDECIKAIIKAKQGKGVHPYTNPPNPRPRPKRPINLQIKEPIRTKPIPKDAIKLITIESKKKPIITELNQEESIRNKPELAKKNTDTELYNEDSNKNINTKFDKEQSINTELEENDKEVSDTELEENYKEVSDTELEENDREESNEKQSISNELKLDNMDAPKTWYNISIFSKYFT